ncbi:hypothetical protein ACQY0O_007507 [Thecaphora frezii]
MDARSSNDALPSAPPEPAGAPLPSQPHSPTHDEKQAEVRDLLASLPQAHLEGFRFHLQHAFSALKLQNEDRDDLAQRRIKSCRVNIGDDFEFIVSDLSALGPNRLPPWLARRIFGTPSQILPDIIPADGLFRVYRTWCTSHERFDFDSALTDLLNLGLKAPNTVSVEADRGQYATYARSFNSDLHGDVVQRFNDTLSKYEAKFDPKKYYGRIIPIVQSSGTGKSRLVHEMRTIWPTLSVTLRTSANDPEGGFPVQDSYAVNYFRQRAEGDNFDLISIAFLAAWFKVATKYIPQNEPPTVEAIFDEDWGHSRADQEHTFAYNPDRQLMFEKVALEAARFVKEWKPKHRAKEEVEPMVKQICDPLENLEAMFKQLLEPPLRQFAQKIGSLEAVKQQTKERGFKKPLVLIAFDECTLLSEFMPGYELLYLRRCFHHIGTMTDLPVSVWLLLLDTSSTISKLWPIKKVDKSLREDKLWQFSPFYDMGFDVLWQKARAKHPRDALKLNMLKYYGRPLWHVYNDQKLIDVAYTKLGGSAAKKEPEDSEIAKLSEALAVSLLSNRICLDLLPLRSDQNGGMVVTTTVERHMRIIVDFDETGRIDTRALSEPMLAIASWYWLSDDLSYPRSWPNVIKYMRDRLLHSECLDMKGVNGELLVRLLLILARDSTVEARKVRELPWVNHAPDMPAIPFQSFLSALLGKSASQLVLDTVQQLDTEAKAKDALSQEHVNKRKRTSADTDVAEEEGQCWVNFTHVTPITLPLHQIASTFLWEAWKRGIAIQCARGQARIDGILPIYRGSLDNAFNNKGEAARHMTYMPWQVKNRDQGTKSTECMHGPLIAHPAKETEEPMFTLLLELGTESAFQQDAMIRKAHPKISVSSFECTQPSCRSRSKLRVVRVRGCKAKVYPCLKHWKVGKEFGEMVKQRISDSSISEDKKFFDDTLMQEVDDLLCKEPA